LNRIPVGTVVHAVELEPGRGAQMARSAGTSAQITAREGNLVTLRLPSGERRRVRSECRATVGVVGNQSHQNVRWGKAGRKRHLGIRPTVRGTVMNPVDHPHGGGEGKSTPGRSPVTPWGKPTLGSPTRKKHKRSDYSPRFLFTWPNSRVSVMGAEQAASVLVQVKREQLAREKKELSEEEAKAIAGPVLEKYEREGDPYFGTAHLWDDGILDPADTRKAIGLALAASLNAPIPATPAPVFRF
jgi:hypothetical protein